MTRDGLPSIAGDDESTGRFDPGGPLSAAFGRLPRPRLDELAATPGLASTVSDVLDELGCNLAFDADALVPRTPGAVVVGHALTLRYLPERYTTAHPERRLMPARLAHEVVLDLAQSGDVLVVDAGGLPISVFGGMAAAAAVARGLGGVLVDGAVRDLREIVDSGLGVWSRSVTPRTGKWRLEAAERGGPIVCGAVQVVQGDLVLADDTGGCFVPVEVVREVVDRVLAVGDEERAFVARILNENGPGA